VSGNNDNYARGDIILLDSDFSMIRKVVTNIFKNKNVEMNGCNDRNWRPRKKNETEGGEGGEGGEEERGFEVTEMDVYKEFYKEFCKGFPKENLGKCWSFLKTNISESIRWTMELNLPDIESTFSEMEEKKEREYEELGIIKFCFPST